MARNRIAQRILGPTKTPISFLRTVVGGSLYRLSDVRSNNDVADIKTKIDVMRALAKDSQVGTAISYYATDATTTNSSGDVIWATPISDKYKEAAEMINQLFARWKVNLYAREHIEELATIGNLYIPTTELYKDTGTQLTKKNVALGQNTIVDPEFDIIPSNQVPPEDVVHVWEKGQPKGYIYQPATTGYGEYYIYPDSAIIHFSLGGLLGKYTITGIDKEGNETEYDIQFANPLMERAVQPTQTLSLLEDAMLLSSLSRVIKFINVEAGTEETEIRDNLQQIKDAIEQQLAINTASGDAQSFVNPQSPNNLIYLPRVNGQDVVSVTDLNMAESNEQDSKLLNHYQDKKLSVLGVPKEAMNFSSNEGLGGAGSVLSQRSAIYANGLNRLETAYMEGWKQAINTYFTMRGYSGFVNKYELHMNPIITELSTVQFDKRDAAINQATAIVALMKDLNVEDVSEYRSALTEILSEVLPKLGTAVNGWDVDIEESEGGGQLDI